MKKKPISKILSIFLILSFFTINTMGFSYENKLEDTIEIYSSQIIYVDDNNTLGPWDGTQNHPFKNIQDGIDNASHYDTVFVHNGTYKENININIKIKLCGENKTSTIIDGGGIDDTIHVNSENVTITGFTITNSNRTNWYKAGIRITCSNNTIYGNNIKHNMLGIFCKKVTNITIHNNSFTGDSVTFSLYDTEEAVPFCEKYFIHNIHGNVVNEKKLLYFKNQKDILIPKDAGQVIAVNCKNMTIRNANLTNADYGCILVNCSDCLIEHSKISYGDGMLWLIHSIKNKIQYNQISNNFEGICLDCGSKRNIIKSNKISNNKVLDIMIEDDSNYNIIFKNNFIDDNNIFKTQAFFKYCHRNIWLRNYWNRPRILPKIILGKRMINNNLKNWPNFDFFPSIKPHY